MVLEYHDVRVNVEAQLHSGVKYRMVDIDIESVQEDAIWATAR